MSDLPLPVRLAAGLVALAVERARKLPHDVSEWPMTAVSQALQLSMRLQQRITELAIKGDEALAALREPEEDPPWAVFDEDVPAPVAVLSTDIPQEIGEDAEEPVQLTEEVNAPDAINGRPFEDLAAEEAGWYQAVDQIFDDYSGDARGDSTDDSGDDSGADTGRDTGGEPDAGQRADVEPPAEAADDTVTGIDTGIDTGIESGIENGTDDPAGPPALPGYPQLSLPSLRGRLRRLSEPQLQQLLEYECSRQARPEFVRMLTNRIATVRNR